MTDHTSVASVFRSESKAPYRTDIALHILVLCPSWLTVRQVFVLACLPGCPSLHSLHHGVS